MLAHGHKPAHLLVLKFNVQQSTHLQCWVVCGLWHHYRSLSFGSTWNGVGG